MSEDFYSKFCSNFLFIAISRLEIRAHSKNLGFDFSKCFRPILTHQAIISIFQYFYSDFFD
jgi:hypothetical protein